MNTGSGWRPRARLSVKRRSNVSVTDMIESMMRSATSGPPFLMYSGRKLKTTIAIPSATTDTIVMNNPCFTEPSLRIRFDASPSRARSLEGNFPSMPPSSPVGQDRLFEADQGLLLRIVHVEHQRELGHHEDVLDLLVHRAELHLGAALGVARVSRDEDAQGDAVHERGLPQVDEELLVPRLGQLPDLGLELIGLLASQEHSLRGEHRDIADGPHVQTHRSCSSLSAAARRR